MAGAPSKPGRPNDVREPAVIVTGVRSRPLRDIYHSLIVMRWSALVLAISAAYLVENGVFAVGYLVTGGLAGARDGSFRDAFYFSVQTMGTIGYGSMHPTTDAANALVVAESIAGLITTALATGIVFARFSRTTGEVLFSRFACISPMDGVPTLTFRIGNDRDGTIFEARVVITLIRTETTLEGVRFYRMYDLELVRERTQALERSFTVMHRVNEASPLASATPESCRRDEVELAVSVVGTDGTSLQPVHARHTYEIDDVIWGARLADVLHERPDGRLVLRDRPDGANVGVPLPS